MQNQRIEQAILKPGGRIDPHVTPKTLQIFDESGLPFNFEGGSGAPGEGLQEVRYLNIAFMFLETNLDINSFFPFGQMSGVFDSFYSEVYFVFTSQTDPDEDGVYIYNSLSDNLTKVAGLSDETPEYDVARVFYTWSGMQDSEYPESKKTAFGPDIPKNVVPLAVSHDPEIDPDSWEAIVYLVENGTRTTPINSDNVSVMPFLSRGDIGELPVGYTPIGPWPGSLTGHLGGIDKALIEANPNMLFVGALISYNINLEEPFEDQFTQDVNFIDSFSEIYVGGLLVQLINQEDQNENGVYEVVGDETYSLELKYPGIFSPNDEGFGRIRYGLRLGQSGNLSFGIVDVNVSEIDKVYSHTEGSVKFNDLEELAHFPFGLPATNVGLVILPDSLVVNSPFADENQSQAMTLGSHLTSLNNHLYAAPPPSGSYTLRSVDGELTWVAD